MLTRRTARAVSALLALMLVAAACTQRDSGSDAPEPDEDAAADDATDDETTDDEVDVVETDIPIDECLADPTEEIEGDEIRLVSSFPQSGIVEAFSEIARGWKAYFDMINEDEGGVEIAGDRYQIVYDDRDDQYTAAETSTNIRELVGDDGSGAFAVFSVVGTVNNRAVREFLGELCVPNVFAATGSPAWGNPDFPWLIGSTLSPYTLETQVFADLLEDLAPDATVAMLRQNDDFGEAYEEGFRQAIEGTDIELVAVEQYSSFDADVSAQMTSLANSNADAFFNGATLLVCPGSLSAVGESDWEPITWVSTTCISKTLMGLSGEAADGVYSMANLKDPLNPDYEDDEDMQLFWEKVNEFQGADFDEGNAVVAYGWTQAAIFVEGLRQAEAPTRLAVMESIRNLDVSGAGLLLDDVTITTSPDDVFLGETARLAQYEFDPELGGDSFFIPTDDPLFDFEGQTPDPDITPPNLITD